MIQHAARAFRAAKIIGLLDIGTSKIVCLVVAAGDAAISAEVRLLGLGHQRARGIKAGVVVDLDLAEAAVRAAVTQAERMAGVQRGAVYLAVACGRIKSLNFNAHAASETGVVGPADLDRLLLAGREFAERGGRALVHLNALSYSLDGAAVPAGPLGLAGRRIEAGLHAVVVDEAPLRNLLHVAERAQLTVAGLVPAPFASALGVTTPEERRQGVLIVDLGAGATTLAMFCEGHFAAAASMPVGGHHITYDIARALAAPLAEAERIKTLYGTMLRAPSDVDETVSYQFTGAGASELRQTSKADVARIVGPRVSSVLAMVAERIDRSGVPASLIGRVVLTGGASQLVGIGEFAARALGRPVRIGRPAAIGGMPESVMSPALATAIGLLHAAHDPAAGVRCDEFAGLLQERGVLGRVGQWLRAGT